MALVLGGLFAFVLLLKIIPFFTYLILLAIIVAIGISLLFRIHNLYVENRTIALNRLARFARGARSILKMGANVEAFYLVGLLIDIVAILYLVIRPEHVASVSGVFFIAGVCLATAGFLDFLQAAYKLTKYAWSRAMGKALLGVAGTTAYFIASAMAKSVIAPALAYDPKYFADSVSIFQTLLTPIAYINICAAIIAPCCIFVVVINTLFIFSTLQWKQLRQIFTQPSRVNKLRLASLPKRLWTGRKYVRQFVLFDWNETRPIIRPMAILAAASAIFALTSQAASFNIGLRQRFIRSIVVAIEFRSGATCNNAPVLFPANYAEPGILLIAKPNGELVRMDCSVSKTPHLP
ncbi:hypothetical protein [Paludibacterium sp. B53371]|uniref:hypothetical protein n=1 Tax=Paludibacterium sp. B53371 TaxID=2806263 RepID=UPI001C054507|nr:hypothetical protein [Paludibacterium sp. B53371]